MNHLHQNNFSIKAIKVLSMLLLLCSMFLTACGGTAGAKDGECKLTICFKSIPREFYLSDENLQKHFSIWVTLKNIVNENLYEVTLDQDNQYQDVLFLHPGIYQVTELSNNQADTLFISLEPDEESLELSADEKEFLNIVVSNPEEFTAHWMDVQPLPELTLADKFDGIVQFDRQLIDLRKDSAQKLLQLLSMETEDTLAPYEKQEITDETTGITLTIQNQTESPAPIGEGKIIRLLVTRNNVLFPQGVSLGTDPAKVCNKETGLYGEPDGFEGNLLLRFIPDDLYAVYTDPVSGDKLTLNLGPDTEAITSILYEQALFEE